MSSLVHWLSNNSIQVDAQASEQRLRTSVPKLLAEDEHVVFAFKGRGGSGRDSTYFTSLRLLIEDVRGITGKKVNYRSIPYPQIQAFATETAGSLDSDTELKVWSKGFGVTAVDFVKGQVSLFEIHNFLNEKVGLWLLFLNFLLCWCFKLIVVIYFFLFLLLIVVNCWF